MCSVYELPKVLGSTKHTHTCVCAEYEGPLPVHVVKLARVKPGEPRRDGFRGNYVSVVSASVSGRRRALIALCIKDYVAASLLLLLGTAGLI